ncbi:NAD(P)-dependent alcohol dehydrogenase [Candidatus Enterococcus mansonii]|nr:NAD(P)-dependent alcohol dehydrogenase [Enterococcus sp. 4G2_DIV0659]
MRAISYKGGTNPSEALHPIDVKIPTPKKNQVLVKVKASSLNIIDFERFINQSKLSTFARLINVLQGKNAVLGGEVSGTIVTMGNCVTDFQIGNQVFGPTVGAMQFGGWAEYALCESKTLAMKPCYLTYEQAAVIPLSGLTALGAVETVNIRHGNDVLIYGASGGVGLYMLQILKAKGVNVTAVCSRRNLKLVQSFNVHKVICYQNEDVFRCGQLFDVVISVNGNQPIRKFLKLLKPEGQYLVVGNARQIIHSILHSLTSKNVKIFSSVLGHNRETIDQLVELLEEEKITPFIDKIYKISDVVQAVNYIVNEHAQGKVALTMDYGGEKNGR